MRKKIGIFLVSMMLVILTFSSVRIINIETSAGLFEGGTPIAHWHFDEGSGTTAYDSSGNNYHITIYGASWTDGVSGSCLEYDHDYALLTNFNRNVYACNVWLKPQVTITKYSGGPFPDVLRLLTFDNGDFYELALGGCTSLVNDETICVLQIGPPEPEPRTAVLDQDITSSEWHMITITWNNGLGRYDIYFDGFKKSVVSSAGGHSGLIYCDDFQIADDLRNYIGKIDEISIYSSPLSENEILALYNEYANDPPNKPILLGQTVGRVGESYVYYASTIDPDGDQLEYWYDWDDGQTSGWLGMYNSGETCEKSHRWDVEGSYSLRVKARDTYGVESEWSNTLSVSMPRNRLINNPMFIEFMDGFIERFPLFARLLRL